MQVIYGEHPPNYKAIAKTFGIKNSGGIVFTYGDKLYVPSGQLPDRHLMRHEETHARQQGAMGVEEWWSKYLVDPGFRFTQELEAYRNQYRSMATLKLANRVAYLNHISTDLAGPMYGNLLTKDQAIAEITRDIILKHVSTAGKNTRKIKKMKRQNRKKGRK